MKILKCSDLIRITSMTSEPISVSIKPLSMAEKMEIASKVKMVKGEEVSDHQAQAFLGIKYAVKIIDGVFNYDGTSYAPEFDGGFLTDSCVDDIINLLSDSDLILPVILSANKSIAKIKGVKVEVNPKN